MNPQDIYLEIEDKIKKIPFSEFLMSDDDGKGHREKAIEKLIRSNIETQPQETQQRLQEEFYGLGPLEALMRDTSISEIIVNSESTIWFEKNGRLQIYDDLFYSPVSYRNVVERLSQKANTHLTTEFPRAEGSLGKFRITLIGPSLTGGKIYISLRQHPNSSWSLEKLLENQWCTPEQADVLQDIVLTHKNFLIVGATSAGKTSVTNALLGLLSPEERSIIIEDTNELALPNLASIKLLTRFDPQGILPEVRQDDLLKSTLRLRPDRIIMGEVRGSEAKDFLMALATGHGGSFGTLHAQDPAQALIRLEMLIQMGAPQWSLTAIRRLIHMSLNFIIVAGRNKEQKRILKGVFRICSLEENGFLIEQVC